MRLTSGALSNDAGIKSGALSKDAGITKISIQLAQFLFPPIYLFANRLLHTLFA